ncbi:MAG: hypothetical protein Ta2E_00270 [Mycoplasmoidaceae bacterium]|nr:MAG: hypothetical protein Ta2E_00270 [Mycoplasmoidaceae bacterium]
MQNTSWLILNDLFSDHFIWSINNQKEIQVGFHKLSMNLIFLYDGYDYTVFFCFRMVLFVLSFFDWVSITPYTFDSRLVFDVDCVDIVCIDDGSVSSYI